MSPLVSDISYHQGNQGDRVTSFRYRYDNIGNIERAEQSDSVRGTIAKSTYRYDRFNQLIQEERDGKTWFYQYDTVGNLLWVKTFDKSYDDYEEAASAVSYKPELLLGTDTYTYGDSEWQDLLTAFNGRSITYDAIGNPLTYYNGTDYTMTWEQGRRLSALHTGEKTVSYRYDSEGKRTGKTVGTGQTEYIYAGGQLVSILGTNPDYRIDLIYDESGVQSCIYTAGTAAPVTYIVGITPSTEQMRQAKHGGIGHWGRQLLSAVPWQRLRPAAVLQQPQELLLQYAQELQQHQLPQQ